MIRSPQPDRFTAGAEPVPFYVMAPSGPLVPCLVTVPHSGRFYPRDLVQASMLDTHTLRLSEDSWVDHLVAPAAALGMPVLIASYGRAYVDLNRRADELDPAMFQPHLKGRHVHVSRRVQAGLGVLPRLVSRDAQIYRGRLPAHVVEYRLGRVYHPYQQAVLDWLTRLRQRFGFAVLLDCHSMPSPSLDSATQADASWPDIVLGDNWGHAANRRLTQHLEHLLAGAGLNIRRNIPYAGGYVTATYGKPFAGIHALQIELSRDLYMDERTLAPLAAMTSLQSRLHGVLAAFAESLPALAEHLVSPGARPLAAE